MRGVRARGRRGGGCGAQASDLAAHACTRARPRRRGREGAGTGKGAVRVRRPPRQCLAGRSSGQPPPCRLRQIKSDTARNR
jgi:hypothetical protein